MPESHVRRRVRHAGEEVQRVPHGTGDKTGTNCIKIGLPGRLIYGASIFDVRTEGGRGVSPKEDVVREEFSTVDQSQTRTRGGQ